MATFLAVTGIEEIDDRLSYLRDPAAKRIGRAAVGKIVQVWARGIRRFIPKSIAPRVPGKAIGTRNMRTTRRRFYQAKAGIGVGKAAKTPVMDRPGAASSGPSRMRFRFDDRKRKVTRSSGRKFAKFVRAGRKGVGVDRRNLHWFALGTKPRFTGSKKVGKRTVKTGHPRKYTGRIDKRRWGGFVQRGVLAMELPAIAEARKVAEKMIAAEVAKARSM